MSDGPSDANAVGGIASELREAAYVLREAIGRAEAGHRGLTVSATEIVNEVLGRSANGAEEMRRLWRSGVTQQEISVRFGTHASNVSYIVRGVTRKVG